MVNKDMKDLDLGHWQCDFEFDPKDWFGFVYRVTNKESGMQYIGRKFFFSRTRKKVKGRKNRKVIVKESDWRTYTTSSQAINDEIKKYGKDRFWFEIIELCKTRGDLTYREVEIQWTEKVLEAKLPDGSRKYYNNSIGAVRFQLSKHRDETKKMIRQKSMGNKNALGAVRSEETRKKMSMAKAGRTLSEETKKKLSEVGKEREASESTRLKMSESLKGRTISDETKKKMSQIMKGRSIRPIPCSIDGKEYPSIKAAAESMRITPGIVKRRIASSKYPDYKLIE